MGVGFSSIDSIVGFLTLEQSNFDLFNPWNFTGGGQRFSMSLRAGSERSEFSVSLVEPWFMDQQLALGGEIFYKQSTYFSDYYEQTNFGAAQRKTALATRLKRYRHPGVGTQPICT